MVAVELGSEADLISVYAEAGTRMVERMRQQSALPDQQKTLNVRIGIAEVADLLGCSPNRIRMAEEDGRLPPADVKDGRRLGYTVSQVLAMRTALGISPRRDEADEPVMLAIQNFKGGVGKSTVTTHLAHYLGLRGYRVLVVDCDSQATTTTLFGFNPHFAVLQNQTLYPFLAREATEDSLDYAIRPTCWPNVDLIPSTLSLFDAEYELAAGSASGGGSVLANRMRKLKRGLREAGRNYDVVILDPPPALGTISLAVMQAANAVIIPLAATTPDFCSTVQFLTMTSQVIGQLRDAGIDVEYKFMRLLCSRHDISNPGEDTIRQIMSKTFASALMPVAILDSAEISHAATRMMTVYELEKPIGAPRTHKRCRENLDEVFHQIETLIRATWGAAARVASAEDFARVA